MFRLAATALFLTTTLATAVDPDPAKLLPTAEQAARAEKLARDLGDDSFGVRDTASRELEAMGRLALAAIDRTLAATGSAEVRGRCESLRPAMVQADLAARLEVFNADADGKYEHRLPGWEKFTQTVGRNAACRKFFSQIIEVDANLRLLNALSGPKEDLTRMIVLRRTELYTRTMGRERFVAANGIVTTRQSNPPTVFELGGVLFIESLGYSLSDRRSASYLQYVMTQPAIRETILDVEKGETARKLLVNWCNTRTDVGEIFSAMTIATTFELKELPTAKLALKVLEGNIGNQYQRAQAITTLAKAGGKEQVPNLEKHFTDKTICYTVNSNINGVQKRTEVQIRDVALAMAIIVSEGKIEDYEMATNRSVTGTARFSYTYCHFVDEEKREAGFKKWAEFRKKN